MILVYAVSYTSVGARPDLTRRYASEQNVLEPGSAGATTTDPLLRPQGRCGAAAAACGGGG